MPTPHPPTIAVRRTRRKLPMAVVADRTFTSRSTLQKDEAGDTSVGMGIYASVLQALGLLDGLGSVADIRHDEVGQRLSSSNLPRRIRLNVKKVSLRMVDVTVYIDLTGDARPSEVFTEGKPLGC